METALLPPTKKSTIPYDKILGVIFFIVSIGGFIYLVIRIQYSN